MNPPKADRGYDRPSGLAAILMIVMKDNFNRKQSLLLHENSGNGGCEKGGQGA